MELVVMLVIELVGSFVDVVVMLKDDSWDECWMVCNVIVVMYMDV